MNNTEKNKYTVDYFINKFTNIPDNKWFIGALTNPKDKDSHCAMGHCIYGSSYSEFNYLCHLFDIGGLYVAPINDGKNPEYKQNTPKARILAALEDIKRIQIEKGEYTPDTIVPEVKEKIVYKTVLVDTNVKNLVQELQIN